MKAQLKSVGRTYKAEGATLEECFDKMKISGGAKATAVLTIENNGVVKEKLLNGARTNHLFGQGSPTAKSIALKHIKALFDIK